MVTEAANLPAMYHAVSKVSYKAATGSWALASGLSATAFSLGNLLIGAAAAAGAVFSARISRSLSRHQIQRDVAKDDADTRKSEIADAVTEATTPLQQQIEQLTRDLAAEREEKLNWMQIAMGRSH